MQAEMPFYDSPEDALKAAVQALGGAKQVGSLLWPDKTADNASRLLLDCLNPGRAEKLDVSQIMRVFRLSRDAGCFAPFFWFCNEIGYDAKPICRDDEIDRLATVIENSAKSLNAATAALERIQRIRAVA